MDLPAHQLPMTVLMPPDSANFSGKVHGGSILTRKIQRTSDMAIAFNIYTYLVVRLCLSMSAYSARMPCHAPMKGAK